MAKARGMSDQAFVNAAEDCISSAEVLLEDLETMAARMATGNYDVTDRMAELAQTMVELIDRANGVARLALSRHIVACGDAGLPASQ
jgi:hypothetical protein